MVYHVVYTQTQADANHTFFSQQVYDYEEEVWPARNWKLGEEGVVPLGGVSRSVEGSCRTHWHSGT